MSQDLQKLHGVLLTCLLHVQQVCQENGLRFYLSYGTALGAYRHQGFIPWDDDVDIMMPRPDYEKFLKIVMADGKGYSIQIHDNEPNYFGYYGKIRKDHTVYKESYIDREYRNLGIYIDIFPMDGIAAPNTLSCRLRRAGCIYINHVLRFQGCRNHYRKRDGKLKFFLDSIVSLPGRLFSISTLLKLDSFLRQQYPYDSCQWVYMEGDIHRRSVFENTGCLTFEGHSFPVPGNMEAYLEGIYGKDYMVLPPEDQRRTHMPEIIDFGPEESEFSL